MTENPTGIAPPAEAMPAEAAPAPPTMRGRYDVIVLGGGIVGLATSYRLLQQRPDLRLVPTGARGDEPERDRRGHRNAARLEQLENDAAAEPRRDARTDAPAHGRAACGTDQRHRRVIGQLFARDAITDDQL